MQPLILKVGIRCTPIVCAEFSIILQSDNSTSLHFSAYILFIFDDINLCKQLVSLMI